MEISGHQLVLLHPNSSQIVDHSASIHPESRNCLPLWTSTGIDRLCCGYLRRQFTDYPNDLGSLLFKYVGLVKCQVKAVSNGFNIHRTDSIIFKLNLSQTETEKNSNNNDCNSHYISIKLLNSDCESPAYENGGYFVRFGVIGVPKSLNVSDDEEKDTSSILNEFESQVCKIQYNLPFDCLQYQLSQMKSWITDLQFRTMKLKRFSNLKKCICIIEYQDAGLSTTHVVYKAKNIDDLLAKDQEYLKHNLFKNDTIDICIQTNINKEKEKACLYFMKNGNKIKGKTDSDAHDFSQGKIKLNFDKYYYYCGMSTVVCGCKNDQLRGFEYEIEYNRVRIPQPGGKS